MHRICRPHVSICRHPFRCSPIKCIFSGRDSGRRWEWQVWRDTKQGHQPNPGLAREGRTKRTRASPPSNRPVAAQSPRNMVPLPTLHVGGGSPSPRKAATKESRPPRPMAKLPICDSRKGAALTGAACSPDSSFLQSASGCVSHSGGSVVARQMRSPASSLVVDGEMYYGILEIVLALLFLSRRQVHKPALWKN